MATAVQNEIADDKVLVALSDGVLRITLNDADGRNVVGKPLMRAFKTALDSARNDAAVRIVLVDHVGPVFCAGADLKAAPDESAADLFAELLRAIQTSPKPTVAKISGHAVGGGVGLAAAFDISIASHDSKFGFTEVRLGVVPAVIAAICLPKMRKAEALEAFLRGTRFPAARASELGLITRAVAADEVDGEVAAVIADLKLGGPEALATAKQIIEDIPGLPPEQALAAMSALSARVFAGDEARAGTTAFKERRLPDWAIGPDEQ